MVAMGAVEPYSALVSAPCDPASIPLGETAGDNETSDTNDAEATRKAAAKAAEEEEEDPCLICHEKLPDVGRGIIIQCVSAATLRVLMWIAGCDGGVDCFFFSCFCFGALGQCCERL